MILSILLLLLAQDVPQQQIQDEIELLEDYLMEQVQAGASQYTISKQSPVRGYYVPRRGVILMIPVRYRAQLSIKQIEATQTDEGNGRVKIDVEERLRVWNDEIKRQRVLKEANFEKMIANVTRAIPELALKLASLPGDEPLTVILEERLPPWLYPGFSLDKKPSTKVVSLTVDNKSALTTVYKDRTEIINNWRTKVKRVDGKRTMTAYKNGFIP